jgi:membrane protein
MRRAAPAVAQPRTSPAPPGARRRTVARTRTGTLPLVSSLVQTLIARTPPVLRRPVQLLVRTVQEALDDRLPGLAAEVAFFMLLSLPPLLLLGLGVIGYVGEAFPEFAEQVPDRLLGLAGNILTAETIATLEPVITGLLTEGRADIASVGVLLTIYSASRALRVIVVALTITYDIEDTRVLWKQRLWGLGLTIVAIVVGVLAIPLLVLGPGFGGELAVRFGLPALFRNVWRVAYWPTAAIVATALVASLYHFAAPWNTPWRRDLPGAALAMVLWMAGSAGLRYYVRGSVVGDEVFAPLAGPLVLLLWLYVSAFTVLLGAEFNAEIEKMWPNAPAGDPPEDRAAGGDA